jgi:regulatory protein
LIEDILETLSSEGLQSDERFAESFVHHCINKGQGPNKIHQEMRQRGVDSILIEQYLEDESINWLTMLERIREKKYGEKLPEDYQNKAKQSRFLYSRGFTSEQISQVLK